MFRIRESLSTAIFFSAVKLSKNIYSVTSHTVFPLHKRRRKHSRKRADGGQGLTASVFACSQQNSIRDHSSCCIAVEPAAPTFDVPEAIWPREQFPMDARANKLCSLR